MTNASTMGLLALPTEDAMPNRDNQQPDEPGIQLAPNSIANWVNRYRVAVGGRDAFGQCSPQDVMEIARDMGVSVAELRAMASKGPHAADRLQKMLIALNVDSKLIAKTDPLVLRDLQRLCINCSDKGRCGRELQKGTAAAHFHEFCPNAMTLDALFTEANRPAKH